MVRVSRQELNRLMAREKNYEAQELSEDVRLTGDRRVAGGTTVWCFIGLDRHRVAAPGDGVILLEDYFDKVVRGATGIDPSMVEDLRRSAAESGFKWVPGPYEFVDGDQASMV
jgi:hypothetical protein